MQLSVEYRALQEDLQQIEDLLRKEQARRRAAAPQSAALPATQPTEARLCRRLCPSCLVAIARPPARPPAHDAE